MFSHWYRNTLAMVEQLSSSQTKRIASYTIQRLKLFSTLTNSASLGQKVNKAFTNHYYYHHTLLKNTYHSLVKLIDSSMLIIDQIFCRIFEHFATKPDPVTEFTKLRSASIFMHCATNPDPVTEFITLESALPSKAPLGSYLIPSLNY